MYVKSEALTLCICIHSSDGPGEEIVFMSIYFAFQAAIAPPRGQESKQIMSRMCSVLCYVSGLVETPSAGDVLQRRQGTANDFLNLLEGLLAFRVGELTNFDR